MKKRNENKRIKRLLTIRVDPEQIEATRKIAQRKSIGYQTLMRMWIAEGIERERELLDRRKRA
jgi:predicted DNA binding CopG/RHH family protein